MKIGKNKAHRLNFVDKSTRGDTCNLRISTHCSSFVRSHIFCVFCSQTNSKTLFIPCNIGKLYAENNKYQFYQGWIIEIL